MAQEMVESPEEKNDQEDADMEGMNVDYVDNYPYALDDIDIDID